MNRFIIVILLLGCLKSLFAQDCSNEVSGFVVDAIDGKPVSFVTVLNPNSNVACISDSLGRFRLKPVCKGICTLNLSHLSFEPRTLSIELKGDTILTIALNSDNKLLGEVSIVGITQDTYIQNSEFLESELIHDNPEKNFGGLLESLSGVDAIKNGSGISKPLVHGLFGNRLLIVNNGVAQSGQQWGIDHSPEIDASAAKRITVIKGVGAQAFQGNSLGSVILVEPGKIEPDSVLRGRAGYFFETNGRSHGVNLSLENFSSKIHWRLTGSARKSGDRKTSSYFLRNTGSEELNLSLLLEKQWGKHFQSDLFLSSFNSNIGILRGSQIGNLTDLELALERSEPFYTEDSFKYDIDVPSQKVNHHLLKFHTRLNINSDHWFDLSYAGQLNYRKEFDVRRSGRSEIPAMSLEQLSNFLESKYTGHFKSELELNAGFQFNRIDNVNIPETGILPLIPDYIEWQTGGFAILSRQFEKTKVEAGGRIDSEIRKVATISNTLPREVVRYRNEFINYSASFGLNHLFSDDWGCSLNVGLASRNPEVNELYSNGLHQGVSGIEEGTIDLPKENSLKSTASFFGELSSRFSFNALFYYQRIDDYIYLNPQDEIRLTIRGAFPVFKYENTNAQIIGLDFKSTFLLNEEWSVTGMANFIEGRDLSNNLYLINMPSNNVKVALNRGFVGLRRVEKVQLQVNGNIVFEQSRLQEFQDFAIPPGTYGLLGFNFSVLKAVGDSKFKLNIRAENLLNESYRNYLNRQRYFADDLGINFIVGLNVNF